MFKNPVNMSDTPRGKISFSKTIENGLAFWAMNEKKVGVGLLAFAVLLPLIVDSRYAITVMTSCALFIVLCLSLIFMEWGLKRQNFW